MSAMERYYDITPYVVLCDMCLDEKKFKTSRELATFRKGNKERWLCINDSEYSLDFCPKCVTRVEAQLKKARGEA